MTRLQDDFYNYVNGEWTKTAVIPEDRSTTGGFADLDRDIEKLMLDTTDKWLAGEDLPEDPILGNFIKLLQLTTDFDKREADGVAPALPLIEEIKALQSFEDFTSKMVAFEFAGKPNLLPFGVAPDFMNAQHNVLWASGLDTLLPDTTYYEDGHEKGAELLAKWRSCQEDLLPHFGFTTEEIKTMLDDIIAVDAEIAKHVLSNEEAAKYVENYHPYTYADFKALVPELPLDDILTGILGRLPEQIIVSDKRFWTEYASDFYSAKNWPAIKASLLSLAAQKYTSYLTDEIRILAGAYGRHLSGTPQAMDKKKAATYLAQGPYSQAIGLWYARRYFSKEAKKDVEDKVATMIQVYKERLETNDWLKSETRDKAIIKLNAIVPHIGYPEKLPETYAKKIIDPTKSLVENVQTLAEISIRHAWSKWDKTVDRDEWHMPAHMVNAYYDPQQNQIVFPAAILQAPFYSLEQSSSANYGGIGAVIAHEISHAFDTNGASFDENGSLKDWWTEEDYAAFKERTDKVVALFDGQESYGAKVNGQLTVSENVADLGGLACALEAAKREDDFSAVDYFTNFATIWRLKAREEYMQMLASVDVHAPGHLRCNLQVPNFAEFHETFGITPDDKMWRDADKRVVIW